MNLDCQHAPATLRNREPIAEVLRSILPASGLVLEVASGTGEHAVYFAHACPGSIGSRRILRRGRFARSVRGGRRKTSATWRHRSLSTW